MQRDGDRWHYNRTHKPYFTCLESFIEAVKSWHLLRWVKESGITSGLTLLSWKTEVWYWHEEPKRSWLNSFLCNGEIKLLRTLVTHLQQIATRAPNVGS